MPSQPPGIRRITLVVDVEGYSRRPAPDQIDIQRRLVLTMRHTFALAGVNLARSGRQNTGDGQLVVLPPGIDEARALPGLINGLNEMLYDANAEPARSGRMRFRAALSQGLVHVCDAGFAGDAVIAACRLLDSMALRAALRDRQDSDLALIVTDDLYTGVVTSGYAGLSADGFSNVVIDIPEKRFHASAWILVPGRPPHAAGRRSRINDPLPPAIDFKTVFPFVAAAAAGGTIGAVAEHINHTHDPAAPDHGAHSAGHGTHGHGPGPHGLGHGTHGPGHGAHDPGGHGHAGDGGGYHG